MKNLKKIGLGLILIFLLMLFISAKGQLLQAATQPGFTKNQVQSAKYTFTDNQTVVAAIAGKDFKFIVSSSPKSTTYFVAGGTDVIGGPSPLYPEFCGLATNNYINIPSTSNNPAKGKVSFSYYDTTLNKCSPYSGNVNVNTTFAGPPISITNPSNGATVKSKVTVSVKALAYVGIAGVQTTVNDSSNTTIFGATSPSYASPGPRSWSGSGSWDTSNLPDGKYTITASLIESDGSNKTATATITTNNGNQTGGSTDPSACVFQNGSTLDTALSWMLCPVINGLSESADGINKWVSSELNFSINDNLGPSVHEAWNVFKYLTSGILVIVMLVMVFAQAIGGGPFDAYTVRKMLPRLVAAVILMQVAWYLCIWFIELANYTGQGIAGLMAAPFGGTGALELGGLLTRLGSGWAATVGAASAGGLITAVIFSGALLQFAWPMLVLALCMIAIAVVVALTTLLFRNAFIILLVMLSPLAILAFVLPGTEKYWKIWRDNFMKLLMFFPLVMAMIYGGRIFAWVAGNLGSAGPLDLIMVLAGFFGPYFFLPKSFRWGGDMLSAAYKGVSESWPIKKGGELASKELMDRQQDILNKNARELDTNRDGYTRKTGEKFLGVVPKYRGSLARTALWNLKAGRVLPTKRQLALTKERGDKWNEEQNAITAAVLKGEQEKAITETPGSKTERPTYTYGLDSNGNVVARISDNATARGKAAIFSAAGSEDERRAGVAVERALKTSSWVEMGKNLVPVEDRALQERIRKSGAEVFEGDENNPATRGKLFVRMYDLPAYNKKVNASEDLYPLPLGKYILATPHITNPENPGISAGVTKYFQEQENKAAAREERQPRPVAPVPHHIARAVETIRSYMDAGNINSQSEAELGEIARLAKQDPRVAVEFGNLLGRIASGGQGGINVLTQLNSSASMQGTIHEILESAPPGSGVESSISDYVLEGRRNLSVPPPDGGGGGQSGGGGSQSGGGGGQSGGGAAGRPEQYSTTSGEVRFTQPGIQYSPQQTPPVEVRIDHEALANTIREASRRGTTEGMHNALRQYGMPQPGQLVRPETSAADDIEKPEGTT